MSFLSAFLFFFIILAPVNTALLYYLIGKDKVIFGQSFGEKNHSLDLSFSESIGYSIACVVFISALMAITVDYKLLMLGLALYWIVVVHYAFQLPTEITMTCATTLIVINDLTLFILLKIMF